MNSIAPSIDSPALPPLIVIGGPTAAGKTAVAFAMAEEFDVHLISADSSQVYRGMDIGTAKPSKVERAKFPQALIDICDPGEPYSAANFVRDASVEIRQAVDAGRIPVVVGGSALYVRALRYGLDQLPSADAGLRAELERDAVRNGWSALHQRLATLDPESARRIGSEDQQRIQRALEICLTTGRPASAQRSGRGPDRLSKALHMIIAPGDRSALHRRIGQRCRLMLREGLLDEARALFERSELTPESTALRAVGYRQAGEVLAGKLAPEKLAERIEATTRQLAKRQLTAFRQWTDALWYDPLKSDAQDRILSRVSSWAAKRRV